MKKKKKKKDDPWRRHFFVTTQGERGHNGPTQKAKIVASFSGYAQKAVDIAYAKAKAARSTKKAGRKWIHVYEVEACRVRLKEDKPVPNIVKGEV